MKKLVIAVIILAIITPFFSANQSFVKTVEASQVINLGDYIQLGSYYGEPIIWRCVDIDSTNGPLMLSDKILTIKSFDAKGSHTYLDGTAQSDTNNYRTNFGSNLWQTSSIRAWLNSTQASEAIPRLDKCSPTSNTLWNLFNEYSSENGFLAEGNFTVSEQNAIKSVSQKSLLNNVDLNKLGIGGNANHTYNSTISTIVQNYETAYYQNVTDKIFLLDTKQIDKIYTNSATLGADYYKGKPTQKAVDNSSYKDDALSTKDYWSYWLRNPFADPSNPSFVRNISSDGYVDIHNAYYSYMGVRPAFYLNQSYIAIKSGTGVVTSPYVTLTATGYIDFKNSTLGDPIFASLPSEGGKHNLSVAFQNNTGQLQNAVVIVAVKYNNNLISIHTKENSFAPSEEFTFSPTITIPSTINNPNINVDFYIWDGLAMMKTKHDTVKNSINNVR